MRFAVCMRAPDQTHDRPDRVPRHIDSRCVQCVGSRGYPPTRHTDFWSVGPSQRNAMI